MKRWWKVGVGATVVGWILVAAGAAHAALPERMERVPTSRAGITYANWWMPVDEAKATVVLFAGGVGGFGKYDPDANTVVGGNFLVRSKAFFRQAGLNVLVLGRPQDVKDLDWGYRMGQEHMEDVRAVIERVKQLSSAPVWLVGTSRGTVSAASFAIHHSDLIAGLVLTSSITKFGKTGNVPQMELDKISVPTLVLHNSQDACKHCPPGEVKYIMQGLKNAPIKKLIMTGPAMVVEGEPCEAFHHHGYNGIEEQTVKMMTDWISNPSH